MMTNLYEVFRTVAERQPNHPAIIDGEQRKTVSYSELLGQIDALAEQLRDAGICPRQCVGLHLPSGSSYLVATYALWKCGACVVPIPLELAPQEKGHICQRISIPAILSGDSNGPFLRELEVGKVQPLGLCSLFNIEPAREHPPGFEKIHAAFIRFSSGTTGDAKGIVLSHQTILDRVHAANEGLRLTSADRVVWLLSMSYHFAVSIVAYLTFGATIILHKRALDLGRAVVEDATEHRGTIIYGGPMQYELMSRDRSGRMMDQVRLAISTATSLPSQVGEAFFERFALPLTQAYGIIEIGLPCINLQHASTKPQSVGQVLPSFELRLIDTEASTELCGIAFRGKGFLDAYYDPWRDRNSIMPDGWFSTGDLGEIDQQRCLSIRGRASDMINVGGMKFFPHEVERVLTSHPAIDEAAVFSATNGDAREFARAQVVAQHDCRQPPTPVELRQFCAKQLAHFKVPQEIEYVPSLERTASGKIFRRAMMRGR